MITAGMTKDAGVLACDSTRFDAAKGVASFESPKLFVTKRYVFSYIGSPLYLAKIDFQKMDLTLDALSIYLKDYLLNMRPAVKEQMKTAISNEKHSKPHFCLMLIGLHAGKPTMAQFNSFKDFSPRYLWSDNGLKFSTLLYGNEEPKKNEVFKKTTSYMEKRAKKYEVHSPGVIAEILTRGIYKKADLETEEFGDRFVGGAVNAAYVNREGTVVPLSGTILL